jgi:predicted alpha/beta-hydrolase family hydrolase
MRAAQRASLAGAAGNIEVAGSLPDSAPRAIAVVAHPHPLYGGTMDNKVVTTVARAFGEQGAATFRFNFRGVGRDRRRARRRARRDRGLPRGDRARAHDGRRGAPAVARGILLRGRLSR